MENFILDKKDIQINKENLKFEFWWFLVLHFLGHYLQKPWLLHGELSLTISYPEDPWSLSEKLIVIANIYNILKGWFCRWLGHKPNTPKNGERSNLEILLYFEKLHVGCIVEFFKIHELDCILYYKIEKRPQNLTYPL